MNIKDFQNYTVKRVKERNVGDALDRVQKWRYIYEKGLLDDQGHLHNYSLHEAADFVGIPKKTLEDYTQIFHKIRLITNVNEFTEKKMGFLRHYIKKNKSKVRKALVLERQINLERRLMKQKLKVDHSSQLDQESTTKDQENIPQIEYVEDSNIYLCEDSYQFMPFP